MLLKFLRNVILLLAVCMSFSTPLVHARVLSGSRTERKMNRKIERLLKSARRNYEKGKVQDALDGYWKILGIDPQETFAYLELGEIYFELRIYDRAVELLEPGTQAAALELDPESVSYYYCVLTQAYIELDQLGPASKALIKAAEAAPKSPLPRKILGDIYLANNRIKSAYKAYKKALSFDSKYEPAIAKIAEMEKAYAKELKEVKTVKKPTPGPKKSTSGNFVRPEQQVESAVPNESIDTDAIDDRPMPMPVIASRPEPTKPAAVKSETVKPEPNSSRETSKPALMPLPDKTMAAQKPAQPSTTPPLVEADPDQIDMQIDKLLAGTASEKSAAVAFFVALRKDGLIEIEELLYDSDPEVRIIAIRTLGAFKGFEDRVINILADAADDPDPEVKKEIARVLKSFQ